MKKIQLLLIAGFTLLSAVSHAQSYSKTFIDSLRFSEQLWSMKKKAAVLDHLQLTEGEKSSFWPVYDSYHQATQYLEIEYIYLISTYAKDYNTLSPSRFDELLTRILKNDLQFARVRKVYYKKFKRALSPQLATTFMQFDNSFRTLLRLDLQKDLPPTDAYQLSSNKGKY